MDLEQARIRVRLTPRSARNEVQRYEGGTLFVRVTAPPVDGAANAALTALLAEVVGLPKSSVRVGTGASSRDKTVIAEGKGQVDVEAILARYVPSQPQEEET